MSTSDRCPRGHALEPNAVLCTVCWVRVEPEDPEVTAARKRRQRRIWIPLFGAGAVLFGVFVGGLAGILGGGQAGDVVAAEATTAATSAEPEAQTESTVQPEPAVQPAAEIPTEPEVQAAPEGEAAPETNPPTEPVTVASVPLAGTVEPPSVTVCLPSDTDTVRVRARANPDVPWQDVPASATLDGVADCAPGEVSGVIVVPDLPPDATRLKLIARDGDGERLTKTKVDAPA